MINLDNYINKIIHGDCLLVLKDIPQNSIDCIITDPPYGIEFMGKDWDRAVPNVEVWKQCLRVLKPGAFMFVMSSPRQDTLSQMIIRLQQAGFETGFTSIYWTYASGFPKAENIAKMVMKRKGDKGIFIGRGQAGYQVSISKTRKEQGYRPNETCAKTKFDLLKPTDEEAKALDGSYGGFQPKPAVEVILVCMKPLSEKTYVDQALKNGKGVMWLDDCRIPYKSTDAPSVGGRHNIEGRRICAGDEEYGFQSLENPEVNQKGRFPANLLVSDDMLNDGKITKSRESDYNWEYSENQDTPVKILQKTIKSGQHFNDSGSFSRYFDLDRWFLKTIENLPENVKKTFPFLICPKASKSERDKGLENKEAKVKDLEGQFRPSKDAQDKELVDRLHGQKPRKNYHPTVKPIKLMSYLITLGSRNGDTILDPFVGSGTTCIAAKLLNRKWIGIEINEEYAKISSARLMDCEIIKHKPVKADQETKIEQEEKIDENDIICPKCGSKMYKGKRGYYCMKINCDGKIDFRKL
jgi:site-specific DNA-methyltransferase (adenine-specific)